MALLIPLMEGNAKAGISGMSDCTGFHALLVLPFNVPLWGGKHGATFLRMNRFLSLCAFSFIFFLASAGSDHIILRDGREADVKLFQVTDQKVTYSLSQKNSSERKEVPSSDVYMVYIEKQGNVYFDREGRRTTGETTKADPRKFDTIYLVEGGEIPAENIRISSDEVNFTVSKKHSGWSNLKNFFSGEKNVSAESSISKSKIFMIRYRSGMIDIITPIDLPVEPKVAETPEVEQEPEFKVVFHSVETGETLTSIAEKYNVTPEQIIEWNDLPARRGNKVRLKADMQLMIYQPNK